MNKTLEQHLIKELRLKSESGSSFLHETSKGFIDEHIKLEEKNKKSDYLSMAISTHALTLNRVNNEEDFVLYPIPMQAQHKLIFPFIIKYYESKGFKVKKIDDEINNGSGIDFISDIGYASVAMSSYNIDKKNSKSGKKIRITTHESP